MASSVEYRAWAEMIRRCEKSDRKAFADYGGRGIRVCTRWRESFEAFLADMGPRPSDEHSLDRIDTNGDYTPENCRWATWKVQQRNRRSTRLIEFRGETRCVTEWAEVHGINPGTLKERLRRGWSLARALGMED